MRDIIRIADQKAYYEANIFFRMPSLSSDLDLLRKLLTQFSSIHHNQ